MEIETTDGTVKMFGPGDLVLLEDTPGKGARDPESRKKGMPYFSLSRPGDFMGS